MRIVLLISLICLTAGNASDSIEARGLLDSLSSLTEGTKLGTALKVISAFNKVGNFFNNLKNIVPAVHQAFNNTITDLSSSLNDLVDHFAQHFQTPTAVGKRGLLDSFSSLTDGTKLGTALKVINAVGKVGSFFNQLKEIAPEVHQAFNESISDISSSLSDLVNHFATDIESSTKVDRRGLLDALSSLTDGTKLGTALKLISAVSKVGNFFSSLKNMVPAVHQAFNNTITDISSSLNDLVDHFAQHFQTPTAVGKRGLLDALSSLTDGTKLGTALKLISAVSKVGNFFSNLKNMVPAVHQAFNNTITDISSSLNDLVDQFAQHFQTPTAVGKRGLLDALSSLTDGTKLGTALKLISAVSKVGNFFSNLKNMVPAVHQAFNNTITDISSSLNDLVDQFAQHFQTPTAVGRRGLLDSLVDDTKLGTALKVINAVGKVGSFFNQLKDVAPEVHQAFTDSISDISSSLNDLVNHFAHQIESPAQVSHY